MKTPFKITLAALALILLLINTDAFSQARKMPQSFIIDYEKSVNTYAIIKKLLGKTPLALDLEKFEVYKKTQPQFKTFNSTYSFNGGKALFTPAESNISTRQLFNIPMAEQLNTVYTDFTTNKVIEQKEIAGDFLLLTDSLRKIRWKITDETREVAGYQCRRANALILDSVYVVAFYTDEIHVSGGPELFSGLPGMILEVALPHDNVIWRATKVTINNGIAPLSPPTKGRSITFDELETTIISLFKNRPINEASLLIKESLL